MIARFPLLLTLFTFALAPSVVAAQSTPGGTTVAPSLPPGYMVTQSPGGYEVAAPSGSLPPDAPMAASSSSFTASGPVGPQQHLGHVIQHYAHYIAADVIAPPIVYGQYARGTKGYDYGSYAARAAAEVGIGSYKIMVGADARRYAYQSSPAVTGLTGQGTGVMPSFDVREYQIDEHAGLLAIEPRIYASVSYLQVGTTANAPRIQGLGYGLEKLVDSDRNFSLHGSLYYYPNASGNYTVTGNPSTFDLSYRIWRYAFGATIAPLGQPFFLDAGYLGDHSSGRTNAPVGFNHQGPYVGLGLRF